MTPNTVLSETVRKLIAAGPDAVTTLHIGVTGNQLAKLGMKPDADILALGTEQLQRDHDEIAKLLEKFERVTYYGNQYTVREDMENPKNGFDKSIGHLQSNKVRVVQGTQPLITLGFAPEIAQYTSRILKLNEGVENGGKLQRSLFATADEVIDAIQKNAFDPDDVKIFSNSIAAGLIELSAYGDVRDGTLHTDEMFNDSFTELGMAPHPIPRLKAVYFKDDYVRGPHKNVLEISYRDLIAAGRLMAGLIHFLNQRDTRQQLDDLFVAGENYLERYLKGIYDRIREVVNLQFFENEPEFQQMSDASSSISRALIYNDLNAGLLGKVLRFCVDHIEMTYSRGPNPLVSMQFCLVVIKRELARLIKEHKPPKKEKGK